MHQCLLQDEKEDPVRAGYSKDVMDGMQAWPVEDKKSYPRHLVDQNTGWKQRREGGAGIDKVKCCKFSIPVGKAGLSNKCAPQTLATC